MFQSTLDQESLFTWSNEGWANLKKQLDNGEDIITVTLPGRKNTRFTTSLFTFFGGDALEALQIYIEKTRGQGPGPIFLNQFKTRMEKKSIKDYWLRQLRDLGKCVVCGSQERVEAAHMMHPPSDYLLSRSCEGAEQFEREMAPFYRPENMVLLCRRHHMIQDQLHLFQEFGGEKDPKRAAELVAKALRDAGVTLQEAMSRSWKRVSGVITEHMLAIYGPGWLKFLRELERAREEHGSPSLGSER